MRHAGTGGLALLRRQLCADRAAVATVAAVVLVTSTLAAAVPRALGATYDAALREAVAEASPLARDVLAVTSGALPAGSTAEPLAPFADVTRRVLADMDPVLRDAVEEASYAVTSPQYQALVEPGGSPRSFPATYLELRAQSGWAERVRWVEGKPPVAAQPGEVAADRFPGGAAGDGAGSAAGTVDMALSARAAEEMAFALGEAVPLQLVGGIPGRPIWGRLAGIFEPVDPDEDFWSRDLRVVFPAQEVSDAAGVINTGVALVAPAGWPLLADAAGPAPVEATVRFQLDAAAVSSGNVGALATAVGRLEASSFPLAGAPTEASLLGVVAAPMRVRSGLVGVLENHLAQRASATAVTSLAVAGLAVVALAVLALAARLVLERRRGPLRLAAARGASGGQQAGALAGEGLLIAAPAAVAGWCLAAVLVRGRGGLASAALSALLVAATALLLPALAGGVRADDVRGSRRDLSAWRSHPRRAAAEAFVLTLAVGGIVLLRRRGLATSAADVGVDPFLVLTPVLLGLGAGILALRLYPLPLRALTRSAARRRGAVPFLGAARAAREGLAGTAPVLVLLPSLAAAVFGAVISATVTAGIERTAWQQTGATSASRARRSARPTCPGSRPWPASPRSQAPAWSPTPAGPGARRVPRWSRSPRTSTATRTCSGTTPSPRPCRTPCAAPRRPTAPCRPWCLPAWGAWARRSPSTSNAVPCGCGWWAPPTRCRAFPRGRAGRWCRCRRCGTQPAGP